MHSPTWRSHIIPILALPFMVLVVIPGTLLWLTRSNPMTLPLPDWLRWVLFPLFFLPGIWLFLSTIRLFHLRGKGTLAPWAPPHHLVIEGPYRYVRNPMISGVLFLLLSISLAFSSWFLLGWSICFFGINHIYFIYKEEPDLGRRFGDDYRRYKKSVRRWIPGVNKNQNFNQNQNE